MKEQGYDVSNDMPERLVLKPTEEIVLSIARLITKCFWLKTQSLEKRILGHDQSRLLG